MGDFKDYIKNKRIESGLSQEDLAKYLKVDKRSVQYWESGETTPRAAKIRIIEKFFEDYNSEENIMIDSENFVEASLIANRAMGFTILSRLSRIQALIEKRPFAAVHQEALEELRGFENEG
ncbi:helix-turn-helix domain-containing protein [Chitinophaga sp. HK235]|uniref:helix-turn-helix domain-containing protein n=1 Tax=Chitinophaga sp. HK235 TaxID=2952571 RepID=UPI001BAAAABF|nr:helix-turn-helix domain-containing protein [Chitinophaga sp. HK235]